MDRLLQRKEREMSEVRPSQQHHEKKKKSPSPELLVTDATTAAESSHGRSYEVAKTNDGKGGTGGRNPEVLIIGGKGIW